MVADVHPPTHAIDTGTLADQRLGQRRVPYRGAVANDRVLKGRSLHQSACANRHIWPDRAVDERYAILDVYWIDDRDARGHGVRPTRRTTIEHRSIRLQQRTDLAGIEPARDIDDSQLCAVVDHVLKRVREVVLALVLRHRENVSDSLIEQLPILDVVEPDVRPFGHRCR